MIEKKKWGGKLIALCVCATLALAIALGFALSPALSTVSDEVLTSSNSAFNESKPITGRENVSIGGYYMPALSDMNVRLMKEMGLDYMFIDPWTSIPVRNPETGVQVGTQTVSPNLNTQELKEALDLFDKYDLGAVIMINNNRDKITIESIGVADIDTSFGYENHKSFLGFDFLDEPITNEAFDWLSKTLDDYNASMYKDYLFATTLLNISSTNVGGDKYEAYINYYIKNIMKKMRTKYLCFDHYPFLADNRSGVPTFEDPYFQGLEYLAHVAQDNGAIFQGYIQALSYSNHRNTSRADLSYQMYAHLAFGASGLRYFTVKSPPADGWFTDKTISPFEESGYIADCYYDAQSVNSEIHAMGGQLLKYDWRGIMANAGTKNASCKPFELLKTPLASHEKIASISSDRMLLTGVFEKGSDSAFLFFNAEDPINGIKTETEIKFNNATSVKVWRKGENEVVSLDNGVLKMRLDEGEGVFVEPVA